MVMTHQISSTVAPWIKEIRKVFIGPVLRRNLLTKYDTNMDGLAREDRGLGSGKAH